MFTENNPALLFIMFTWSMAALLVAVVSGEKALFFQPDNQLSDESSASLYLPDSVSGQNISDLTVCCRFKIHHFRSSGTYLFSYAVTNKDNNEMNLGIKPNGVFIALSGSYFRNNDFTIAPDVWYHVCFVFNSISNLGTFFINGERQRQKQMTETSIALNGSLVLGQETDEVNGGFQAEQSFSGILTDFNWYSRSLSEEEVMKSWMRTLEEEGDLVGWSSAEWDIHGPVDILDLTPDEVYSIDEFRFTVIQERRNHEDAVKHCEKIKTTLALPTTDEENSNLYSAGEVFAEKCQPPNHNRVFFWLGTRWSKDQELWIDDEGIPLNYTSFEDTSRHLGYRRCSGYVIPPHEGVWLDVVCRATFCFACQEKEATTLKLRGLCEEDSKAHLLRIEQRKGEMPTFRGYTKYLITFDTKNSTWELTDTWMGRVIATYFTHEAILPLGLRDWRTEDDYLICKKEAGTLHTLSLSACYDDEYTCGEGTCISLTKRCDLRADCPDNSDEERCDKLILPTEYLHALPPPGVEQGPLALNLSVSVHGFSQVDIRDMKLTVDFSLVILWFDLRLRFQNLKRLVDLNYVNPESVWTPVLELVNADFPRIHRTPEVLTVRRISLPEDDLLSRPYRDELYEGAKNPLQLSQKVNAPFQCPMNLRNFPFDIQHCALQLRLISASKDFLHWGDMDVSYLGEDLMTEYAVGEMSVHIQENPKGDAAGEGNNDDDDENEEEYSMAIVKMKLSRRYGFYLTSAYLPTVMLMIISYASLWCKRESRDLRVMMSITTLLVLYALYQQISNDLPRTSYTKAIDVWCFFAITFIFSQVIFHVAIDVKWRRRPQTSPRINDSGEEVKLKQMRPKSSLRCQPLMIARIVYVLVFLIFCLVYWTVVLVPNP